MSWLVFRNGAERRKFVWDLVRMADRGAKVLDLAYEWLERQLAPPRRPQHILTAADLGELEEALYEIDRLRLHSGGYQAHTAKAILETMYRAAVGEAQLSIDDAASTT